MANKEPLINEEQEFARICSACASMFENVETHRTLHRYMESPLKRAGEDGLEDYAATYATVARKLERVSYGVIQVYQGAGADTVVDRDPISGHEYKVPEVLASIVPTIREAREALKMLHDDYVSHQASAETVREHWEEIEEMCEKMMSLADEIREPLAKIRAAGRGISND